MVGFSLKNKTHTSRIVQILEQKRITAKELSENLKSLNIFDAYLHKNCNKCNLTRYLLWLTFVSETHYEYIKWMAPFIKMTNMKNWDKEDIYYNGVQIISYIDKDTSEDDSGSEQSVDDEDEDDDDGDTSVGTSVADTDVGSDDGLSSDDETEKLPSLSRDQVLMILGKDIELTERGKNELDDICDDIVSRIGYNQDVVKKLQKKNPKNQILSGLVKPKNELKYEVFILQSFRFLILKSAFDYCKQKKFNQVRQSTIKHVCSTGDIGKTLKLFN